MSPQAASTSAGVGGRAVAAEATGEGLALEYLPLDLTQSASVGGFAAAVRASVCGDFAHCQDERGA